MDNKGTFFGIILAGAATLGLAAHFMYTLGKTTHETITWKKAYSIVESKEDDNNTLDFPELEDLGIKLGVVKKYQFNDFNELEKQVRTADFSKVEEFVNEN